MKGDLKMDNEIRNENELLEVAEPELELEDEVVESKGKFRKIATGVAVATVGVGTTLIVKNRDKIKAKIEARKTMKALERLETNGYVVYKAEDVYDVPVEETVNEEE